MTTDDITLRLEMADLLAAGGALRSEPWRKAVEAVPRHQFLSGGYFVQGEGAAWRPVMPADPGWLAGCYGDESLVTQIAGTIVPGDIRGEILRAPTSSSTMPRLVVRMLEDLRVEEGGRVLEIGTGTGYSTALLCHRLGQDAITSVEVDPDVSARAGASLRAVGYEPQLVIGDGLGGYGEGAPYDRTIATCGVTELPYAWVEQTRPGGTILAAVGGWLGSSELARLTVGDDGTARGPLLGGRVGFMLARPQLPPPLGMLPDLTEGEERPTSVGADLLDDWTCRFVAQIAAPRAQHLTLDRNGVLEHVLIDVTGGSWAALTGRDGEWTVRQSPGRHLWDAVEEAVLRWRSDGGPGANGFMLEVTPDGTRVTWTPV
ncbi:ATP-grasp peptide maturase system methyltransferase [Streptomyces sp. NPDC006638]|uniref:ATP-grasp peptide maturase system methyltransferase n=1 Tax=Streptomyces sp. NPDC006638 TaxID=3157183 RepID=UPI0033A378B0